MREDLYFRMNVIQLRIPPLRERKEDILLWSTIFYDKHRDIGISRSKKLIRRCCWRVAGLQMAGNVRELQYLMLGMFAEATHR
jgi:transcriptional regulator with PAS, ATPase and Fis domain